MATQKTWWRVTCEWQPDGKHWCAARADHATRAGARQTIRWWRNHLDDYRKITGPIRITD